ncbi:MAG: ABC transporter ATP-binding protein, partial [Anaerolineales bacterium]
DSADTFVATFLGSPGMNLIERDDYLIGFRPEQFVPKETADKRHDLATFSFQIGRVEYLGADQLLYGEVGEASDGGYAVAKLSSEFRLPITAGETYEFSVQQKQLRFFDKSTGRRTDSRPI